MRIISGKYRGRKLFSPENSSGTIKPTLDRVKENIFNILANKDCICGFDVMDIFCGSGALGIEALSRGANSCVFVDNNRTSLELTKKNLTLIGESNYELWLNDYATALKRAKGKRFGAIFSDSPYKLDCGTEIVKEVLENELLIEGGALILEHSTTKELHLENFPIIIDNRVYGAVTVSIITLK